MEVVEVTKRRTKNSQKSKLTVDNQNPGIKVVSKNKPAKNGVQKAQNGNAERPKLGAEGSKQDAEATPRVHTSLMRSFL